MSLRILGKIAENEAVGIFHPKDARTKIAETAFINDFHIIYADRMTEVKLQDNLADIRRKLVREKKITSTDEISDEKPKEENKNTQAVNKQQIIQNKTDCQAIENLQAKSELSKAKQSTSENPQSTKNISQNQSSNEAADSNLKEAVAVKQNTTLLQKYMVIRQIEDMVEKNVFDKGGSVKQRFKKGSKEKDSGILKKRLEKVTYFNCNFCF